MSDPFGPHTPASRAALERRGLAAAVLAALGAEASVGPDRSAARATQQQADDDAHAAALAAVDAASQQLIARIRVMSDAEMDALDAATLASILEAVTPVADASLEAWRAQIDADLAQAPEQRQALQSEIDGLLQGTEQRLDAASHTEEETEAKRLEAAVARKRTPLDQAEQLTVDRLAVVRRYITRLLPLNWVGYAAPGTITAVDLEAQLATVRLTDGSGLTIDGVEYGSGTPRLEAPTVLHLGVRMPDPRAPTARPVPAGRAWITVPGGGRWLYYWHDEHDYVARIPWPPDQADVTPEILFHPCAESGDGSLVRDPVPVTGPQMLAFLGRDGLGAFYLSGFVDGGQGGALWRWDAEGHYLGRTTMPHAAPTSGPYGGAPLWPLAVDASPGMQSLIGSWTLGWGGHSGTDEVPGIPAIPPQAGPAGWDLHCVLSLDGGTTWTEFATRHYHTVTYAIDGAGHVTTTNGPDTATALEADTRTPHGWRVWTVQDGEQGSFGEVGQLVGWGAFFPSGAGGAALHETLITLAGEEVVLPQPNGGWGPAWGGGPRPDGQVAAVLTSPSGGLDTLSWYVSYAFPGGWNPLGGGKSHLGPWGYLYATDRGLDRLLLTDNAHVLWWSEDAGTTWTQAAYQDLGTRLPHFQNPTVRPDWLQACILEDL